MHASTIAPERPWPYGPVPQRAARPLATMARLAWRAAGRLLAFDDRMLRDLDLGWDTIEPARAAGRT